MIAKLSPVRSSHHPVSVEEVGPDVGVPWDAYIAKRGDTTFVDSRRWRDVVEKSYRLSCHWYLAKRNGEICGVLALTLTKHPLFGAYLCTAPFGNYGGFYFDSEEARDALLAAAAGLRSRVGARYVNLRHLNSGERLPADWRNDCIYAIYWLALPVNADDFLRGHVKKSTRWLVNKALASGLRIEFGGLKLIDDFWTVMMRSMKELGSPYHSRDYLVQILDAFGEDATLGVVYAPDGKPVGASLVIFHHSTAVQVHANVLRSYRSLLAGEYLYFSVIGECCRRGVKRLDLGRSLIGSGNEAFKMKWRPERHELAYWHNLARAEDVLPALHQNNPKLRFAVKTWQRLPLWLHRVVGPRLITGVL